jgi:PhzF family phenazine biosynthesis protein
LLVEFRFQQVDVFTDTPLRGNPLAVVIGADALSDAQMADFANWTNLSETAFLLRPRDERADYRVRIFTPRGELPFAGHPTLGSCHVWLANGGVPKGEIVVQECGVGLVEIRKDGGRLAFAAPPATRRDVEPITLEKICLSLRITPAAIVASQWLSDPPFWVAVMLRGGDEVLAIEPDFAAMAGLEIGVIGPWKDRDVQYEVRGFAPSAGIPEDPVTGSLNAGLAQWLIGAGMAPAAYVAAQGTALGRAGRVHVRRLGQQIWIGGDIVSCIAGTLTL